MNQRSGQKWTESGVRKKLERLGRDALHLPEDAIWSQRHEQITATNPFSQSMLNALGDGLELADIARSHGVSASDLETWLSGVAEVFSIEGGDTDRVSGLRMLMTEYRKWISTRVPSGGSGPVRR